MNALPYEGQEAWEGSHKFMMTMMKSTDRMQTWSCHLHEGDVCIFLPPRKKQRTAQIS